jgi:hypothetical protein
MSVPTLHFSVMVLPSAATIVVFVGRGRNAGSLGSATEPFPEPFPEQAVSRVRERPNPASTPKYL